DAGAAGGAAGATAREGHEDAIELVVGEAGAAVVDVDARAALGTADAHADRAAGRRVVERVAEQVAEHAGQRVGVAGDRQGHAHARDQADAAGGGAAGVHAGHL